MAKLWRVLNAKVLHLMDLDALRRDAEQDVATLEKIAEVCDAVDIPVQVRGGIRTLDDIQRLLSLGVYRVVLGSAASLDRGLVSDALDAFTASRIVVAVDVRHGAVVYEDALDAPELDPIEYALDLEALGCGRIAVTDMDRAGSRDGVNVPLLRSIAERLTSTKITAAGGIAGYPDLVALMALRPLGVDSAVIERALYENAFPCQQFWCWHDPGQVDLDVFSTAKLKEGINAKRETLNEKR
jgi:phosphoribosylformimino-5-aminoimidazole carboxamide ribotide isomerase